MFIGTPKVWWPKCDCIRTETMRCSKFKMQARACLKKLGNPVRRLQPESACEEWMNACDNLEVGFRFLPTGKELR